MAEPNEAKNATSEPVLSGENISSNLSPNRVDESSTSSLGGGSPLSGVDTPSDSFSPPSPEELSRVPSFTDASSAQDDWEIFPPLDRLTIFDFLDNIALPQGFEKWQNKLAAQRERVRRQREKLRSSTTNAKNRVVEEWRRRLPPPDEQLDRYKKRMRESVDRLGTRWTDTKSVTAREKVSFIGGVLNIFISGYLIGAHPEMFYYWFTAQIAYYMPIRYITYHRKGYHYFLADLCYFVNLLLLLMIWVAPQSKRLFISTYCLAYGNNAIAIAMWRNSMVFHSLDKMTSMFIHIMPPVTLHCLLHLTSPEILQERFPAIYAVKFSHPNSNEHYSLWAMMGWTTVPYGLWQLAYHIMITVRRRDKIAAGRPTSFTWMRKSYSKTWIGRLVLALPDSLQEVAFMLIQYLYALLTIVPCPIWFWNRWPSAGFLLVVFVWSVYNGATFYIDVFGTRFQKELEQLKKDVVKWQTSPTDNPNYSATPRDHSKADDTPVKRNSSVDQIPALDLHSEQSAAATGVTSKDDRKTK